MKRPVMLTAKRIVKYRVPWYQRRPAPSDKVMRIVGRLTAAHTWLSFTQEIKPSDTQRIRLGLVNKVAGATDQQPLAPLVLPGLVVRMPATLATSGERMLVAGTDGTISLSL